MEFYTRVFFTAEPEFEYMELPKDLADRTAEDYKNHALLGARLIMGWLFFAAGVTKLAEGGLNFGYASVYLSQAVPISTPAFSLGFPGILQAPGLAVLKAGAFLIEPLFQFMAGLPFMGSLVVVTQLLVGIALILGAFTRLSGLVGAFMATMFYYGNAEWSHGLVNGDLIYVYLFLVVAFTASGRIYGLDARLENYDLIEKYPKLKLVLG